MKQLMGQLRNQSRKIFQCTITPALANLSPSNIQLLRIVYNDIGE